MQTKLICRVFGHHRGLSNSAFDEVHHCRVRPVSVPIARLGAGSTGVLPLRLARQAELSSSQLLYCQPGYFRAESVRFVPLNCLHRILRSTAFAFLKPRWVLTDNPFVLLLSHG